MKKVFSTLLTLLCSFTMSFSVLAQNPTQPKVDLLLNGKAVNFKSILSDTKNQGMKIGDQIEFASGDKITGKLTLLEVSELQSSFALQIVTTSFNSIPQIFTIDHTASVERSNATLKATVERMKTDIQSQASVACEMSKKEQGRAIASEACNVENFLKGIGQIIIGGIEIGVAGMMYVSLFTGGMMMAASSSQAGDPMSAKLAYAGGLLIGIGGGVVAPIALVYDGLKRIGSTLKGGFNCIF